MIKKAIILLFVMLISLSTTAQDNGDRFPSYESMIGKRVRFYDALQLRKDAWPYAYKKDAINGRFIQIKDDSFYKKLESSVLEVKEVVSDKKSQYLRVEDQESGDTCFWKIDNSIAIYSYVRDIDYWEQVFQQVKEDYAYIRYPSELIFDGIDTTSTYGRYKKLSIHQELSDKLLLDRFLPISWISYRMPKTRDEVVVFDCEYRGLSHSFSWTDIKQNQESFASKGEVSSASEARRLQEETRRHRDSIEAEARRLRDSIADKEVICEARILHLLTANTELIEEYNDLDTLFFSVFECIKTGVHASSAKHFRGYVLGHEIMLPQSALSFNDLSSRGFIESRGAEGREIRRIVAQHNDSIRTQEYRIAKAKREAEKLERENRAQKQLEEIYKFRKQKKIVILSCRAVRSDPSKGITIKVYNPFDKAIKYLFFKTVAINSVDDPETDDLGRSEKEVKCIGFVEKGEECTYSFEDLFWDKNDIIHKIIITNIKVVFSDNSYLVYSGKAQVESHMELYYAKELLKLIGEDAKDSPRQEPSLLESRNKFLFN